MAKLSEMPLEALYERDKLTPKVIECIQEKESFGTVSNTYCEKVCRLKCKAQNSVKLLDSQVDILIIQEHSAIDGKFDRHPGSQEAIQFKIMNHICKRAGFNGLTYRLTNLLKCPVSPEDQVKGKAPSFTTIKRCAPYLLEEIRRCQPRVVLSLSTNVTKALGFNKLSNSGGKKGNRGWMVKGPGYDLVLSLHPKILSMIRQTATGSNGMWGSDYFDVLVRDFGKAARLAKGELEVKDLHASIMNLVETRMEFARSIDDVKSMMARLSKMESTGVVSLDAEMTGLDPWASNAKILTYQFGFREFPGTPIKSFVVPLWHRENTYYDPNEAWKEIIPFLESDTPKVLHNGKFDIIYTAVTTGVRIKNVKFDTMMLLHSIDSGAQGTYSLKASAWDYVPELGVGGYEDLLPDLAKGKNEEENEEEEEENECGRVIEWLD